MWKAKRSSKKVWDRRRPNAPTTFCEVIVYKVLQARYSAGAQTVGATLAVALLRL